MPALRQASFHRLFEAKGVNTMIDLNHAQRDAEAAERRAEQAVKGAVTSRPWRAVAIIATLAALLVAVAVWVG
jgi:hypothetical protein